MRYLNKIASAFCAAALGLLAMTSCEGGDLYNVNSPDWLSEKIDSINNAKGSGQEEVLEGMMEDVYTIGATDYSTGWWAAFSKYYQIADGQTWNAQFNLSINPDATNTYKNFALIICNDEDRGAADYKEYGAIRFDHQPASNGGNSEWGDHIKRDNVTSTLTFQSDTDKGVDKLGGKVTLTIDRSNPNDFIVKITNGTVTKTYNHKAALENPMDGCMKVSHALRPTLTTMLPRTEPTSVTACIKMSADRTELPTVSLMLMTRRCWEVVCQRLTSV